jgi:hypothetical protein
MYTWDDLGFGKMRSTLGGELDFAHIKKVNSAQIDSNLLRN